jgi:hypothetical protein
MLDPKLSLLPDELAGFTTPIGEDGIQPKVQQIISARGALWQEKWDNFDVNWDMFFGRQWDEDEIARIKDQGREPLVFNKIEPIVRNIFGKQSAARLQWKCEARPKGTGLPGADANEKAAVASKMLNAISMSCRYDKVHEPAVFRDGIVGGVGVCGVRISRTVNNTDEIVLERVNPKYCVVDPTCTTPDLSDARWMAVRRNYTVPEALEMWPEAKEGITAWRYSVDPLFKDTPEFQQGNNVWTDNYLLPVVEFYERRRFPIIVLIDENGVAEDPVTEYETPEEAQQEKSERDAAYMQMYVQTVQMNLAMGQQPVPEPRPCEIEHRMATKVVQTTFLATNILLSEVTYTDNVFPYEFFFPYWFSGDFAGVVDVLKPGQKYFNRWITQIDYILGVSAKAGKLVDATKFADPQDPEDIRRHLGRSGAILFTNGPPEGAIKEIDSSRVNSLYADLLAQADRLTDQQIPAVAYTAPMPGAQGGINNQSGTAINAQQHAADTGSELWFEQFKLYRESLGKKVMFACEHWVSTAMVYQYAGNDGGREWLQIQQADREGTIFDESFAVTVSDEDFNSSARQKVAAQLGALMQMTAGTPMQPQVIAGFIEASDIPESIKAPILQMAKMMATSAAQMLMAPPMGGPQGQPASNQPSNQSPGNSQGGAQ